MKIIATIADDNRPEGWPEDYTADSHGVTVEGAHAQIEA
ncbi:hypothetical protein UFOVP813_44 [uncultured Caudovirales phage]|uniref:Uncharacterized protein n=1 Tax=uncultured Caudovirales phage TaxID=2100421 RepID=A0A6J5NY15_9CAUD|nr:hypothetical protein UFOVP813_44 [uncultured Caudovirales phage]